MQKLLSALLAAVMAMVCAMPAGAERNFPDQARRGDLKAYQYPTMKIGERIYRLAPGSRIFNQQNLIITPTSLQTQTAPVMYMLDMAGDLSRIWLLTRAEAEQHPLRR